MGNRMSKFIIFDFIPWIEPLSKLRIKTDENTTLFYFDGFEIAYRNVPSSNGVLIKFYENTRIGEGWDRKENPKGIEFEHLIIHLHDRGLLKSKKFILKYLEYINVIDGLGISPSSEKPPVNKV